MCFSVSAMPSPNLWQHEDDARAQGFSRIAGVDEAGRGPLAGPVVAACVLLPEGFSTDGIRDSKTLSPAQRARAFQRIMAEAEAVGIGQADADEIDAINILRATHLAMRRAIHALSASHVPDLVLVDGLPVPNLPCAAQRFLVKGDSLSVSIAAASIIAKETRDLFMREMDAVYPLYGFAAHKGYGAPIHMAALSEHGPCPLHRQTFAPVRACLLPR